MPAALENVDFIDYLVRVGIVLGVFCILAVLGLASWGLVVWFQYDAVSFGWTIGSVALVFLLPLLTFFIRPKR